MGKAREQEVRLTGLAFVALAILTALFLLVAAVRFGAEARSHSPGTVATPDGGAPLDLGALRQP